MDDFIPSPEGFWDINFGDEESAQKRKPNSSEGEQGCMQQGYVK